jgi:hypothetical protein
VPQLDRRGFIDEKPFFRVVVSGVLHDE